MTSTVFRVVNDLKKVLISSSLSCCPYCGALTSPNSETCSFCGETLPSVKLEKLLDKFSEPLSKTLASEELNAVLSEVKSILPSLRAEADNIFREIDEGMRTLVEKKLEEITELATSEVSDRLMRIEEEVSQLMIGVLEKLRKNSLDGFNVVLSPSVSPSQLNSIANSSEDVWNSVNVGIPESIVARFESSISLRRIGDFLYRAGKYGDAIKWYSRAMMSIMYPPSYPKGNPGPKYALGEFIPFGALKFEVGDLDSDGKDELIYVPSREIGGIRVINSVVNKGGTQWPTTLIGEENSVIIPLIGNFSDNLRYVFAKWSSVNLLDAYFINRSGGTFPLVLGEERAVSIAAYDFVLGDVDGDGYSEIIAFRHPSGVSVLKYDGESFREINRLFLGKPCVYDVCDIDGDGRDELILVTVNGSISIINFDETALITNITERLTDTTNLMIVHGDLDGDNVDEVYLSTNRDGILQLKVTDGKVSVIRVDDSSPQAIVIGFIDRENYLISLNSTNEGYELSLFSLEEVMGVSSLSKKYSVPLYLPENVNLSKAKTICSGRVFDSRPIAISLDVDGDRVSEVFLGLDRLFIGLDLKF